MRSSQISVFNFQITNQSNDSIDINIDGNIVDASTQEILRDYWGDETSVSFKSFRNQIDSSKAKTINLFVNSGGGHVGDAMAMHDYLVGLENAGVTVNRIGRGIVASAATYLIMGKNSSMTENSWFMIHNVSGGVWGDVTVIENYAKTLRKFNNAIRDFYARVTGQEPEQVSALMNKETWMTAQEAKDKGFVSNVTGSAQFSNSIPSENWQYENKNVLAAYNSFTTPTPSNMDNKSILDAITNGFNDLMNKLGLTNKKDDEATKNAMKEFSDAIVNAIPKGNEITDEKISQMITDSLGKLTTLPENFTKAITDATANSVTKEDMKNLQTDLVNAIAAKLGNGGGGEDKERKPARKAGRFDNVTNWEE